MNMECKGSILYAWGGKQQFSVWLINEKFRDLFVILFGERFEKKITTKQKLPTIKQDILQQCPADPVSKERRHRALNHMASLPPESHLCFLS